MTIIVSFVSYKGGVGKTTIAANLAAEVKAIGGVNLNCHAMDFDPQNELRLHFGIPLSDNRGIGRMQSEQDWGAVAMPTNAGVTLYPHGDVTEQHRLAFESLLSRTPNLLRSWAQSQGMGDNDVIFIDTPPGPSPQLKQALTNSDYAIVVLQPDAASFATIDLMNALIKEYDPHMAEQGNFIYLINCFDESRRLDRDVLTVIRHRYAGHLAPIRVHYDAGVREALAAHCLLRDYEGYSQTAADLHRVAHWLMSRLGLLHQGVTD